MNIIRTIPEIWFFRTLLFLCSLEIVLTARALIRFGQSSRYFLHNILLIVLSAVFMAVTVYLHGRV